MGILHFQEEKLGQNHFYLYRNPIFPWKGNLIPRQKDQNTPIVINYHRH